MKKGYFKLFACCIPVKGASRSIICDLQRYNFEFIPNAMFEIIEELLEKSVYEIKKIVNHQYDEVIDSYFKFLEDNEFGFWCEKEELKNFSEIDMKWETPLSIENMIIDFDSYTNHNIAKIAKDIEILGCNALQLRFYDLMSLRNIKEIVQHFDNSRLTNIEIILKYNHVIKLEDFNVFLGEHQRIKSICVHTSPETKYETFTNTFSKIYFTEKIFESELCCGEINAQYFKVNINLFTEAHNYNTCLNKKIWY